MKQVLLLLMMSSSAFGSSYQMFCSNPEGTVLHKAGMIVNETVVTMRQWEEGLVKEEKLVLKAPHVRTEKSQTISQTDRCDPALSVFYRKILVYKQAHIVDEDFTFPANTVGLNPKTGEVVADMLCETFINVVQNCDSPAQEPALLPFGTAR